uniref:Signal peptidase I n=1 Tax=uncultured Armatimonadetes bacterium TaxID=157466 RepID=A0A6J4JNX6_9BACT|nr:Signal peptidase I [uncultured Armatimonadetes bacterium]
MEQLTERIASISPQTILLVVAALTAARALLQGARVAAARFASELCESVLIALVLVFLVLRPFVVQSFFIPSGSMHPTLWEGDHILVNKWSYRFAKPKPGEVVVFRAPKDAAPDEKEFIKRLIGVPGDVIEVREGYVTAGTGREPTRYTHSEIRAVLGSGRSVSEASDMGAEPLRLTTDAIWLGRRKITPAEFARAAGKAGQPVRIVPGKVLRNDVQLCEDYAAEDPEYHWGPREIPEGDLFVLGDNRNQSHDSHKWGMLPQERIIGRAEIVFWPFKNFKRISHDCAP